MTTHIKEYKVGKVKQLIDLNGESVNFEVKFRVTSKNKEPFQIIVLDQNTLDNTPNIEYKSVEDGEIQGTITEDKNVYQNYFIVLKSEQPCICEVEIMKNEIQPSVVQQQQPQEVVQEHSTDWKKIALTLAIIGGLGYLLYYCSKNKKETPKEKQFTFSSPKHSPIPSPYHTPLAKTPENPFLKRLKNLDLSE